MSHKKRQILLLSIIVLCCGIMAVIDGIVKPHYWVKSAFKIVLFLAVPFFYSQVDKGLNIKELFKGNKKGFKTAFALCIPVFVVILGAYFLFKDVFDFSSVTTTLTGDIGVSAKNFVYVAIYISFVNSLLEEFFFRGFAFIALKNVFKRKFACYFSALCFSIYHIAIMTGWFSLPVFIITLSGLFIGGVIFNFLNEKSNNIYTSWFVHMFANFAINTIGFMLFGII